MKEILFYCLFAVAGFFAGTWGWGQIIGSTVAAGSVVKQMKAEGNPLWSLAAGVKKRYTTAVIIWVVILAALTAAAFVFFPQYAWLFVAGLAISLLITFKNIPSYKSEFLKNIGF